MFCRISEQGKVAVAAEDISVTDAAFGLRRLAVMVICFSNCCFFGQAFTFDVEVDVEVDREGPHADDVRG